MNTQAIIDLLPEIDGKQPLAKNESKVPGVRQKFLPISDKGALKKVLSREYNRMRPDGISLKLSRWLTGSDLVSSVVYPDPSQKAKHPQGSLGNILKFSVRNSTFGFNLLRSFFSSGNFTDLAVQADNQQREFRVEIRSTDYEAILEYFKRLLGHLEDELRYRRFLSRQIEIEKEISKTFGLNISDFK